MPALHSLGGASVGSRGGAGHGRGNGNGKGKSKPKARKPLYAATADSTDAWMRKLLTAGVLSPELLKRADEKRKEALRRARKGLGPGEEEDETDVWEEDDEAAQETSSVRGVDQEQVDRAMRRVPRSVAFSRTNRFSPPNPVDAEVARNAGLPSSTQYE